MNRYRYRSWSRRLFGLAARVLAVTFALASLFPVLRPLLTVIAAVAITVMVATVWARWQLFRYRGW